VTLKVGVAVVGHQVRVATTVTSVGRSVRRPAGSARTLTSWTGSSTSEAQAADSEGAA
jgi:hypothetical protein